MLQLLVGSFYVATDSADGSGVFVNQRAIADTHYGAEARLATIRSLSSTVRRHRASIDAISNGAMLCVIAWLIIWLSP